MTATRSNQIPYSLLALVARIIASSYTRAQLVGLFLEAGAVTPDPLSGSKLQTAMDWLRTEANQHSDLAGFLGKLMQDFFEGEPGDYHDNLETKRSEVRAALSRARLQYANGGTLISHVAGPASATLAELISRREFPAVLDEFERSTANVATEPREAASAAANMLEAICKEYIEHHPQLETPRSQDLAGVFAVVRGALNLDPKAVEDDDLRRVLGGLGSIVDGLAAYRTHASSAHAQATSKRRYKIEPRHARLVVGAAHVVVTFIFETWNGEGA